MTDQEKLAELIGDAKCGWCPGCGTWVALIKCDDPETHTQEEKDAGQNYHCSVCGYLTGIDVEKLLEIAEGRLFDKYWYQRNTRMHGTRHKVTWETGRDDFVEAQAPTIQEAKTKCAIAALERLEKEKENSDE